MQVWFPVLWPSIIHTHMTAITNLLKHVIRSENTNSASSSRSSQVKRYQIDSGATSNKQRRNVFSGASLTIHATHFSFKYCYFSFYGAEQNQTLRVAEFTRSFIYKSNNIHQVSKNNWKNIYLFDMNRYVLVTQTRAI